MGSVKMSWARQLLVLQEAERRTVQASNHAHANARSKAPGALPKEELDRLDAAARAAQDAVSAHFKVRL